MLRRSHCTLCVGVPPQSDEYWLASTGAVAAGMRESAEETATAVAAGMRKSAEETATAAADPTSRPRSAGLDAVLERESALLAPTRETSFALPRLRAFCRHGPPGWASRVVDTRRLARTPSVVACEGPCRDLDRCARRTGPSVAQSVRPTRRAAAVKGDGLAAEDVWPRAVVRARAMRREQRVGHAKGAARGRGARCDTSSFGRSHEVIRSYAAPTQSCLYTHVGTNVRRPDDSTSRNRFVPSNRAVPISLGCFSLDGLLLRLATRMAVRK
jgi:hypothetical protein